MQRAPEEGLHLPLRDQMARLRLSLYADDVVVFINPVKADVEMVMQIMHRFGEATRLCIKCKQEHRGANQMFPSQLG
jgi:hypothetical protein